MFTLGFTTQTLFQVSTRKWGVLIVLLISIMIYNMRLYVVSQQTTDAISIVYIYILMFQEYTVV